MFAATCVRTLWELYITSNSLQLAAPVPLHLSALAAKRPATAWQKMRRNRPSFSERIWTYLDISRLRTAKDSNGQQWTASPRIFPGVLIDEAKMTKLGARCFPFAFHRLGTEAPLSSPRPAIGHERKGESGRVRESQLMQDTEAVPPCLQGVHLGMQQARQVANKCNSSRKSFWQLQDHQTKSKYVKVCQSKIWEVCMTSHCPCCPWLDKSCDLRQELVAAYCHNTTAAASQ